MRTRDPKNHTLLLTLKHWWYIINLNIRIFNILQKVMKEKSRRDTALQGGSVGD